MSPATRNTLALAVFLLMMNICSAQSNNVPVKENDPAVKQTPNPFRILTAGKQITIKSAKGINYVMLWTAGGHRVVEQKDINTSSYTINITINEKIFFLMLGLNDGKIYTEKIGVQ
jgi:hypothetical protein